jgi:hypothetical protein
MKYLSDIETFNEKIKRIEKLIFLSKFFKNKKLILTTLEEQNHAGKLLLTSILKYSHIKGEVTLGNEPKKNMQILKKVIAKKWEIQKEISHIVKIFEIHTKHKSSPVEFLKKGAVIILDEHQNIEKINLDILKNALNSIKTIKDIFHSRANSKEFL